MSNSIQDSISSTPASPISGPSPLESTFSQHRSIGTNLNRLSIPISHQISPFSEHHSSQATNSSNSPTPPHITQLYRSLRVQPDAPTCLQRQSVHPMITRTQTGNIKPRALACSQKPDISNALANVRDALQIKEWKAAMLEECNALL